MEKQQVLVGTAVSNNSGLTRDTTRAVVFDGQRLGVYHEPGTHEGTISDTRGTIKTLYRAGDGRLIVHSDRWSNWQTEATSYTIHTVTQADLEKHHPFLAEKCGFGKPLTLDQALALGIDEELTAAWDARAAELEEE